MRGSDGFQVQLRKPEGQREPWPELTGPDGACYICGVPQKAFEVQLAWLLLQVTSAS